MSALTDLADRLTAVEEQLKGGLDPNVLDRGKLLRLLSGALEIETTNFLPGSVVGSNLGSGAVVDKTPVRRQVYFGTGNITWPGAVAIISANFFHAVDNPEGAVAMAQSQAVTGMLATMINGLAVASVTVRIQTTGGGLPAVGTVTPVAFIVWGT